MKSASERAEQRRLRALRVQAWLTVLLLCSIVYFAAIAVWCWHMGAS